MGVGPSCGISACWFINWPLHMEGKERLKKDTDHSRWVSSSLNEQGNLYRILVLGSLKMRRSPHLPAKILSLFGGLNWAQSSIQARWPQHHTALASLHPWNWLLPWERWAECSCQGQGRGRGHSDCLGPAQGSPSLTVYMHTERTGIRARMEMTAA